MGEGKNCIKLYKLDKHNFFLLFLSEMINHEGHIAYLILLLDRIPIINLFKSTALVFDIRSQSGST